MIQNERKGLCSLTHDCLRNGHKLIFTERKKENKNFSTDRVTIFTSKYVAVEVIQEHKKTKTNFTKFAQEMQPAKKVQMQRRVRQSSYFVPK